MTLVSGLEQAFHFQGSPMDGPLQLFNALRRIAAGQQPGVDFQFFHGLGVPYLHYIPFRIFGSDFAASEVTRQALTALAYPLILVAFFRAFTRDWKKTLVLSSLVMALSIALRLSTILVAINSLLGVRSLFATLVPIVWYIARSSRWRPVISGGVLGLALLTGTEQGMAAFASMLVVGALLVARDESRATRAMELAITLGIGLVVFTGFLFAVGGWDGLRGALRYNLELLPGDQYWYFGAPPNPFIGGFGDALRLMLGTPLVPIAMASAIALFVVHARGAWRARDEESQVRDAALAMLCLYGVMSSASVLGIFLVGYVHPCVRVVLLVATLGLSSQIQWTRPSEPRLSWTSPWVLAAIAAGLMLVSVPVVVGQSLAKLSHVIGAHLVRRQGVTYEGFWPRAIAIGDSVVRANRLSADEPVWSTYAGVLESRHDMFNPGFDYIIHALGPDNRRQYTERFVAARPRIVQTVLPQFSEFEPWLESTSWDFYRELVTNYRAATATRWSIFWERLPTPTPPPFLVSSTRFTNDQDTLAITLPEAADPNPSPVLLQIEVLYGVRTPLSWLPIFGALPRHLVELDGSITRGPVTLDPHVGRSAFPVVVIPGRTITLRFHTRSLLPGASLNVNEVRVSAVPVTPNMIPWLQNLVAAQTPQTAPR